MIPKAYAEVIVEVKSAQVDRPFHYSVPAGWEDRVHVGTRVLVSFGPRKIEGYIVGFSPTTEANKTKPLLEVLDDEPPLTEDLVELANWLAERYLSTKAAAVQALLPSGMRAKATTFLRFKQDLSATFLPGSIESDIWQAVQGDPHTTKETWLREHPEWRPVIRYWVENGVLEELHGVKHGIQAKTMTYLICPLDEEGFQAALDELSARATKQREVLQHLYEHGGALMKDVLAETGASTSTLKPLLEKGYVCKAEREVLRDPYGIKHESQEQARLLTPMQQNAYDQIKAAVRLIRFYCKA